MHHSSTQKIGSGIDKNLRSNLEQVTVQIDDIQHRLDALLVTTDNVLEENVIAKLEKVRTSLAKIPKYREKCALVKKRMELCDRRVSSLAKLSLMMRTQLPVKAPFVEEFPLGSTKTLFYRVIYGGGVSLRTEPSFDAERIDKVIAHNEVFRANVRISLNGRDVFVGLEGTDGWVFEAKGNITILERISDPNIYFNEDDDEDDDSTSISDTESDELSSDLSSDTSEEKQSR